MARGGADAEAAAPMNGGGAAEAKRHLEKEAFQLANYYFVFQGVIFTAFFHAPSPLKCRYKWVPMSLSALAGALNACALYRIALSYKSCLDDADGDPDSIAVACARWWRRVYVYACMIVVLAFLVVTLVGCWLVTCAAPSPPDND